LRPELARDRGSLIVVEGIDGAGKTTLVNELVRRLRADGQIVTSRQRFMVPELTGLWQRLLQADAVDQAGASMLAVADYHIGAPQVIEPALAAGHVVVMDRYVYSHIVHYTLRGIDRGHLEMLFGEWLEPDLVLQMTLSPELALARKRSAHKPDFWESGLDSGHDVRPGRALREYSTNPPSRAEMERRFIHHQAKAAALFSDVLPPTITVAIDASQPSDAVAAHAWIAVAGVLSLPARAVVDGV
jgi:dTMP kinase